MYFSEYLVLEPSIYDEISSTRHLTRKYRLRQEGKELRRNISSESMCDLRGYFAPGDSVAHFTPERGLLLSSQQQGTFDLHPIVREYAYDRLVDKKAIHIRLRDCFTSVPVAKQ